MPFEKRQSGNPERPNKVEQLAGRKNKVARKENGRLLNSWMKIPIKFPFGTASPQFPHAMVVLRSMSGPAIASGMLLNLLEGFEAGCKSWSSFPQKESGPPRRGNGGAQLIGEKSPANPLLGTGRLDFLQAVVAGRSPRGALAHSGYQADIHDAV